MSAFGGRGDGLPLLHDTEDAETDSLDLSFEAGLEIEHSPLHVQTGMTLLERALENDTIPETATFGRNLGWFHVYSLIVSRIIGSGIFATPGSIYRSVG